MDIQWQIVWSFSNGIHFLILSINCMSNKPAATISEMLSALLILVWVYAAISKLTAFDKFNRTLKSSPLIAHFSTLTAIGIPILELVAAAFLFMPRFRLWGFATSFMLMLLFTGYLGYMITFVPHLPCSCGGILESMTWKQHFVFNIVLTILSAMGLLYQKSKNLIAINTR